MNQYPEGHHPVFFLINALRELGADAEFVKDERTLNCWGMKVNGKLAVYLIDNRHPHEAIKEDPAAAELLKRGALVCCAQRPDAERVGGRWLPLAVTPGYGLPLKPVEKLYDVGFVGYVRDAGRTDVLRHVARHFNLKVAEGVFGPEAVNVYWQSRVGLNVPTNWGAPDSYDSANMRCFEILATGVSLVTPYETYLKELGVIDDWSALTYKSADELISRLALVLDNPHFLVTFSNRSVQLAQEQHTYAHRAQQVLEWLK